MNMKERLRRAAEETAAEQDRYRRAMEENLRLGEERFRPIRAALDELSAELADDQEIFIGLDSHSFRIEMNSGRSCRILKLHCFGAEEAYLLQFGSYYDGLPHQEGQFAFADADGVIDHIAREIVRWRAAPPASRARLVSA